ncbi:MAG TPA: oxygenase MpaB family protein [Lunatimonas sp.]|nr:oxygenase MpaB family protein [Lunatimonas sp.]
MKNKRFTNEISNLDPNTDWHRIAFLLTFHCFPWDMEKALEFALFRTFGIPAISKLLAATGEFTERTRKRYDDTELILYEILENGMDSERGRLAIARMNAMHGRFRITNDDYLYVLSTFIFEPIRWMDKFGWRPFTRKEKEATFINYIELAKRMGIQDVPATLEEFEVYNRNYERNHFKFDPANHLVGIKTLDLLLGFYLPGWLIPFSRPAAISLMDPPLRKAMGFENPPLLLEKIILAGMKTRAAFLRFLPESTKPKLGTLKKRHTYPNGYEIQELGTFR